MRLQLGKARTRLKSQQRRIHFRSHLARCCRKQCLEGSQTEGLLLGGCWPEVTLGAWPPCWRSSGPPGCPAPSEGRAREYLSALHHLDEVPEIYTLEERVFRPPFWRSKDMHGTYFGSGLLAGHGRVHTGGREWLHSKHEQQDRKPQARSFP